MLGLATRTIPYLTGLLKGKKGVDALLAAKKATDVAKGAAGAGAATRAGIRKAADFLVGKELVDDPVALAWRLGPDALGAGLNTALMGGDPMTQVINFGTEFGLSGVAGLGAGRLARRLGADEGIQTGVDWVASMAGGYGSLPASDALHRLRDPDNLTPYERMALENQRMMEEQLRAQIMREYGLTADSGTDPFLVATGLGA